MLAPDVPFALDAGGLDRHTLSDLAHAEGGAAEPLALRVANLTVMDWSVWAREDEGSLLDELLGREARCLVVDLVASRRARSRRSRRQPCSARSGSTAPTARRR